jgi:hypothetical protein
VWREPGMIDSVMMRMLTLAAALIAAPALGQEGKNFAVEDVASVSALPASQPGPGRIAFSDHHQDRLADPVSGLMRFADWAQAKPVQKQFLSLFPAYDEAPVTVAGKAAQEAHARLRRRSPHPRRSCR